MSELTTLAQAIENEQKAEIQKSLAIEKALNSGDVNEIYQARSYLRKIEQRQEVNSKSMLVDPMELTSSFGYKEKPFNLSYEVLRAMARTHIVKAIIETRKEQVLNFCEPQKDKFSAGFIVQKRSKYTELKKEVKLSKKEEAKIEYLIEFLLSCGTTSNFWHSDTFDTFVSKIVTDSLTLDQATFEIVRDKMGVPIEFFATDAATYRIADTYNDSEKETRHKEKIIQGYAPSYVQLYLGKVADEFYPWELCFGVRNPQTDLLKNGYGKSELEDMVQIITSFLNSDTYNANFFKVGSSPKGILRYSGNINMNTLEDFRSQWQTQVAGVMNSHKMPIVNADKLEFINTHVPNKDMEFSKFQEFLIKMSCAQYKIDPSEVGFNMSGSTDGSNGLGGEGTEEKVKFSKDKGLKPLLKKIQYWINKYLIWQLDEEYEFRFVGIEGELDEQTELDRDVLMLGNFMTLNEIRAKRNLDPIEGGDIPLNPVYLQAKGMDQQNAQQQQGGGDQGQDGQEDDEQQDNSQDDGQASPFGGGGQQDDPFIKSLGEEIAMLLR